MKRRWGVWVRGRLVKRTFTKWGAAAEADYWAEAAGRPLTAFYSRLNREDARRGL